MKKLVLTGAAGRLGGYLREPLAAMCDELITTDIADGIDDLAPNETYVKADLGKLDEVTPLLEGADMVVHFGAIGDEAPWDQILHSNLIGSFNIWEAARIQGVRRVVYASSIHAVGLHRISDNIGVDAPHNPDSYYGLAKCFAEDCAKLYFNKEGIEAVCMRIYSCAAANGLRSLQAWLSVADLIRLVQASITTPVVDFTVVYGVSNNTRAALDNSGAAHLGYRPQDNAEDYAPEIFANSDAPDRTDPAQVRYAGVFAKTKLGQSGLQFMNAQDEVKS
ncbi:MAG: NAD-dependent epimerase/dehydratase family protein [Planktomarina sp.]